MASSDLWGIWWLSEVGGSGGEEKAAKKRPKILTLSFLGEGEVRGTPGRGRRWHGGGRQTEAGEGSERAARIAGRKQKVAKIIVDSVRTQMLV